MNDGMKKNTKLDITSYPYYTQFYLPLKLIYSYQYKKRKTKRNVH